MKKVYRGLWYIKSDRSYYKWVGYVRYLGILLGDRLNWKEHIIALCQKLTKILIAFKLIKNLVPTRYRDQLYYAYVSKLQRIQNKIIKVLYKKNGWHQQEQDFHKELKRAQDLGVQIEFGYCMATRPCAESVSDVTCTGPGGSRLPYNADGEKKESVF